MPSAVMNTVFCARASILAIVSTIVTATVSIVANVHANPLSASNTRSGYSENGSTNESKFLHGELQIQPARQRERGQLFRDLLPLFPEWMFIGFKAAQGRNEPLSAPQAAHSFPRHREECQGPPCTAVTLFAAIRKPL
jgi:hypothetical protein